MYHFCHGDFGKSQKSGFLIIKLLENLHIKISRSKFLLRIFRVQKSTKVRLQGIELPTANNPGMAARFQYGREYLKHVSQRDSTSQDSD